jgi:hypothetical protein
MSQLRDLVSNAVSSLPNSLEGLARRLIDSARQIQAKLGRIDHRPTTLAGHGVVVLLDARGLDVDATRAAVERLHSGSALRIILVTDDASVHLYRLADTSVVEFVPRDEPAGPGDRVAELVRQYRVERTYMASQIGQPSPRNG